MSTNIGDGPARDDAGRFAAQQPPVDPPAPAEAPAQQNPWQPWEQVGFQPDLNPYEVKQAYDGWNALRDRNQRDYMLERIMQGYELPEGMSWTEAREAIQQAHQQRQDPFGQMQQQPQYDPQQYAPEQPYLDPSELRNVWQQDMQQMMRQEAQRIQQEQQQQMFQMEFGREMQAIPGLDDRAREFVGMQAWNAIQANPAVPVRDAVANAHSAYKDWLNQQFAALTQQQTQVPQTMTPTGQPASPNQPPRTLAEAQQIAQSNAGNPFFQG